ncbi:ABC transporter transmembrane domain-containing protein [Alteromonas halophila]|uniref:ABC transporter transmembrane domain-containing protein n=1 Tax=Alteromonas halophila TaxID=516698 RepID=UPI001E477797|nr:ABC transporter transmembrane domain-containing protein [Alteromonas halophila]
MTQSSITTTAVIRWLAGHLSAYKRRVWGACIALLVAAGAWLLLGQGIRYAVDSGLIASNPESLNQATLGVLAICVIAALATYARFYLMTWLGERVSADIRQQVYHHLLHLPPAFFAQMRTGEVISRFTSDTTVLQTVVGMSLSMAIRAAITFIGALILMAITSPLLTFCVLLAVPAVLVPIRLLAPKVRRYAKLSQDRIADLGSHIDQSLHEITTVQAYTAEQHEARLFSSRVEAAMDAAKQRIHYRSLLIGGIMLLSLVSMLFIAWVGARQVFDGSITVGELSAFLFYAVMAGGSVATLSEVIGEVQRGVGASERLLELLSAENPLTVVGQPLSLSSRRSPPAINIEAIQFAYPDAPVLFDDLTVHISAGETVALVGPSGAGKSTLFQLLMRFHDVQAGQVTLNDVPVHQLPLDVLRKQIAIVTQEPVVFADSVLENIRYGRPDASDEEVHQAARSSFAHEFIDRLDQGYHTQLGERGVKLSGGQRQRIAIARAILSDRPVLLLDEATSALDAMSEKMVQQALKTLMQGRTTLVIAHRLATVQNVDRIIVMDNGRVENTGTHDELLKSDTLYRGYAELQLLT